MSKGANVGYLIFALFISLFGLCFVLVGGGCTIMLLLDSWTDEFAAALLMALLVALAVFGLGVMMLWKAYDAIRGAYSAEGRPKEPSEGGDSE